MKIMIFSESFKIAIVICIAAFLCSCAAPDPLFLENSRYIKNVDYPKNKIVGTWVLVLINPVQSNTEAIEHKVFIDLRPGGRGTDREVVINKADGGRLSSEAEITWSYQGKNWWKITTPPASQFKTTDSYRIHRTPGGNENYKNIFVRYYNDALYDFESKSTLVRATPENVSQIARSKSAATTYLYLNNQ